MGFSWRGRSEARPVEPVDSAEATGYEVGGADADLHMKRLKDQHRFDPFMDISKLDAIDNVIESGDIEKEAVVEEQLIGEDSPYAEVRASVSPGDDPDLPVDTIRAWTIGFITCTVVAAMNILLNNHYLGVSISTPVVQLIAYPMGMGWANYVPAKSFTVFGKEFHLNPGPFNKKEHTIITVMTAAGAGFSYAFDILLAQQVYYKQFWGWGFQLLLVFSTQAMGFGIAGMLRRFLVWPAAMVWPGLALVFCTVMDSLHNHAPSDPSKTNGWKIGRYYFFMLVSGITFCYEWIPNVMANFLVYLGTFPTWIAPNNVAVNQAFGGVTGIGILPISLDWSGVASWFGNPILTPGFALLNMLAGGIFFLFVTVLIYFAGPSYNQYLPMVENANFDRYANNYNTSRILNADTTINEAAYKAYSPLILPAAFGLSYAMGFATLASNVSHVIWFYGRDVVRRVKDSKYEEPDVHLKLMRKYPEVPEWWYSIVFLVMFAFGMLASQLWTTHLTWWAYIICIGVGAFFVLPVGIIQAVTNQQTGLNIITEMIVGYMLPGKPIAMMMFKSWGYMLSYNSLTYVQDMKIGHYMKIPPRSLFRAQLFAVLWLSVVQTATFNWMFAYLPGICTKAQPQGFTCAGAKTFYNASVIWGVIGPARMFGAGSMYSWANWFFLIGFACPIIQYYIARKYPRSILRYVFFPALFGVSGMIPPATIFNLLCYLTIGIIFNVIIKRKFPGWWERYTYSLAGALDVGNALCLILYALALGLSGSSFPEWWGTTGFAETLEAQAMAVSKTLKDGEVLVKTWN
ncbi:hypothetical protein FJTKL_00427 [Diaporthe vaccinii]|uniref:OPT family small oligopeptide transporter n=2 Tax=Diaporthe vaccinii TaxID=105482 RepID=A0ABR4E2V7_9PEZI